MIDFDTFLAGLEEYRKHYFGSCAQEQTQPNTTESTNVGLRAFAKKPVTTAATECPQEIKVEQDSNKAIDSVGCAFCISNKERPAVYKSHCIKDEQGKVTCPVLRAYVCPLCSATGDSAHTIRYCQRTAVGAKTSGFLRTPRNSAGRLIRQQKP